MQAIKYNSKYGLETTLYITTTLENALEQARADVGEEKFKYELVELEIPQAKSEVELLKAELEKEKKQVNVLLNELAETNNVLQDLILMSMNNSDTLPLKVNDSEMM